MKKFAFYVSGGANTLKKFFAQIEDNRIKEQIVVIISDNPDDFELAEILDKFDAKLFYFDLTLYEKEKQNNELSNFILNKYLDFSVDFGFIFGGRILNGDLLTTYKNKIINFHPAILPAFKGIKAIDKALNANAFLLGNSAHIVVDKVDSGAVIMQNILHSSKFKNYSDVLDNQIKMLYQIILWINQDRLDTNNDNAKIIDAKYEVQEFIPNLEINHEMQ